MAEDMLDGKLGLTSPGLLGKGSTFWFELSLPVRENSNAEGDVGNLPAPADSEEAPEVRHRVLIVDDSSVSRLLLGRLLRRLGVEQEEAEVQCDRTACAPSHCTTLP